MSERIDALASAGGRSVVLKVNGQAFGGWKALRAESGMEQCSGGFQLSVTDRWSGQGEPWQIRDRDACELLLANQTVITGFVDTVVPSFDKQTHGIRVVGRDRTMDLIDCVAGENGRQWKRAKLDRIARDICRPFGIDVIVDTDVGAAFDSFQTEEGERAFEAIDRAARMRAVLAMTDGRGNLLLTRASTVKSEGALVQGVNIYAGEMEISSRERFSQITVKGQGKGSASEFGSKVAHGKAMVTDDAIRRYRPLVVIAEHHGIGVTLQQRAEWELNVRRGRGTRGTFRVQGWTIDGTEQSSLWRPNTLVPVSVPYLGTEEDLLIAKCVYTLDETGSFTDLTMVHPSAFSLLAGVQGTRLNRLIRGRNGAEQNRKHAKDKVRNHDDDMGAVFSDWKTGNTGGRK